MSNTTLYANSVNSTTIYASSVNNNSVNATSTPNTKCNGKMTINEDKKNGDLNFTKSYDLSPVKSYINEQLMNSINSNSSFNGINNNTTTIIADIEGDVKKRRIPDKSFYIAKETFMTELTYKKDLDVINVWFRNEVGKEEPEECSILLTLIAPLAEAHSLLVNDLDNKLKNWDVPDDSKASSKGIAEVLLTHLPPLLPIYEEYLDGHVLVLEKLDSAFKQNNRFEQLYRKFESQKVCYLPFTSFVLKPLHRLLQYQNILKRLSKHYGANHPDRADCLTASDSIKELIQPVSETLEHSENLATLIELQRDIVGFDNLVQPNRKFIRHGCLLKNSRRGYQQRMFFLFSDILLYTSRSQATLQFKVHGHLPLRGVLLEEPEGDAHYGFIIYGTDPSKNDYDDDETNPNKHNFFGGNRALAVAANCQEEKDRWKEDLENAIQLARDKPDAKVTYLSLKSCSSSDEVIEQCGTDVGTQTKPILQRNNNIVHVCWHRNTSICMRDQLLAVENQLSGYLLRKFKSTNGWQKLWVVFSSFCLFFYKSYKDFPLASLPLLGYSISPPAPEDNITKDFVFKLQYKNHVYFFRAESSYSYNRWMEVIGNTTQCKASRKRRVSNENSIETSPDN